ncbi:MAG: glycosyltransferase family 39 protein [bacterium]|nr:glycosyltransferase family 39 protein [bacterium]
MDDRKLLSFFKGFRKNWLISAILLTGVLAIGFALRRINLLLLPIFADEAIYVRWAQIMKAEPTLRFLPLQDGKQPFFMWVIMPLLKFAEDPLFAGRIISSVIGLVSIIGIFLITYELFKNKKAAIIASLLAAVSPFMVFFDRMALVDSMLTAFSIFAMYFAVLTAKYTQLSLAIFTGFALGFAWLTKSPAMFFIFLLPSTALLSNWPKQNSLRAMHLIRLFFLWGVSSLIAFGMYNILRLGPSFHLLALRNQDYVFTWRQALVHPLDPFQFHMTELFQWLLTLLPTTIFFSALLGIFLARKTYWREVLFLMAWTWAPLLVIAEIAKVFTARYMLYAIPPFFILAALPFTLHPDSKWLKNKRLVWLLLILVVSPALLADYKFMTKPETADLPERERSGYLENWTAGQGIREIAVFLKNERKNTPAEQNLVVGSEGFFGTPYDGLMIYLEKVPGIFVTGIGTSVSDVHESLLNAQKAGDKVYLVINSSRMWAIPDDIGVKLIASFPKAVKANGSREELLFFEVTDQAIKIADDKKAQDAADAKAAALKKLSPGK